MDCRKFRHCNQSTEQAGPAYDGLLLASCSHPLDDADKDGGDEEADSEAEARGQPAEENEPDEIGVEGDDAAGEVVHFRPALQNAIIANRQMPTIPIVTPSIVSSLFLVRNTNG